MLGYLFTRCHVSLSCWLGCLRSQDASLSMPQVLYKTTELSYSSSSSSPCMPGLVSNAYCAALPHRSHDPAVLYSPLSSTVYEFPVNNFPYLPWSVEGHAEFFVSERKRTADCKKNRGQRHSTVCFSLLTAFPNSDFVGFTPTPYAPLLLFFGCSSRSSF